jgi:hypothetical protein
MTEWWVMETANFVIALVGLVAAVFSLAWQTVTFFLSGIRLQCEMLQGAINPGRQYTTRPIVDGRLRSNSQAAAQGFVQDALFVTVYNTGRLPFSVKGWNLVLEGGVRTGLLNNPLGPNLPHRLDVGEEATWAMHLSQARDVAVMWRAQQGNAPEIRAWMEVQVGNGKTYKSKQVANL